MKIFGGMILGFVCLFVSCSTMNSESKTWKSLVFFNPGGDLEIVKFTGVRLYYDRTTFFSPRHVGEVSYNTQNIVNISDVLGIIWKGTDGIVHEQSIHRPGNILPKINTETSLIVYFENGKWDILMSDKSILTTPEIKNLITNN